jgi:hypothetical protein
MSEPRRRPARAAPAVLVLALALVELACGTRSALLPTTDGSLPQDGVADSGLDSMSTGDVLGEAPGDRLVPSSIEGIVYITENLDAKSGAQQGSAYAIFTPNPHPFFAKKKDLGDGCALYPDDDTGPTQYSAGKVVVKGGTQDFSLEPEYPLQPGDWLYPALLNPDYFSTQSLLDVEAAGDQVPAFSGQVGGVGDLDLFGVKVPKGSLSRSSPTPMTWQTGTVGTLWVVLLGLQGSASSGNVRCTTSAGSGSFTFPKAALAALPSATTSVFVGIGLAKEQVVDQGSTLRVHLVTTHMVTTKVALVP